MDELSDVIEAAMSANQRLQEMHQKRQQEASSQRKQKPVVISIDGILDVIGRTIPTRFHEVVRMMMPNNTIPEPIAAMADALASAKGTTVPFLTLVGKTGAGKTSTALAVTVALHWFKRKVLMESMPFDSYSNTQRAYIEAKMADVSSPYFVYADEICTARRTAKLGEMPDILRHCASKRLLIIDDVIGQKDADGDLYAVIRDREAEGLMTIITSGLPYAGIEAAYGAQFARRMFAGTTKVIERKS